MVARYSSKGMNMTFGLKALFWIAPLLLLLAPSKTAEVTYKESRKGPSIRMSWKRGFVFGIFKYMSAVAEAGGIPHPIWSRFVEAYVARSPVNAIAKGQ